MSLFEQGGKIQKIQQKSVWYTSKIYSRRTIVIWPDSSTFFPFCLVTTINTNKIKQFIYLQYWLILLKFSRTTLEYPPLQKLYINVPPKNQRRQFTCHCKLMTAVSEQVISITNQSFELHIKIWSQLTIVSVTSNRTNELWPIRFCLHILYLIIYDDEIFRHCTIGVSQHHHKILVQTTQTRSVTTQNATCLTHDTCQNCHSTHVGNQ